jgi:D-alanyl-D-alanine dipeptidase
MTGFDDSFQHYRPSQWQSDCMTFRLRPITVEAKRIEHRDGQPFRVTLAAAAVTAVMAFVTTFDETHVLSLEVQSVAKAENRPLEVHATLLQQIRDGTFRSTNTEQLALATRIAGAPSAEAGSQEAWAAALWADVKKARD